MTLLVYIPKEYTLVAAVTVDEKALYYDKITSLICLYVMHGNKKDAIFIA